MVVTFSKIAFALLTTGVSLTSVYATGGLTHDDNGRGGISPLLNEPLCWNYSYPICNHPTPLYGCLRGTMIDQEDYLDPHGVTTHYVWTCNLESSAVPCVVPKSQDCDEVSADVSLLVPDQGGYSCGGRLLTATAETFEEEGEVGLAEDGQAGGFAVEHNQDISVRLMIDGVERPSVHPRLGSGTVTFPIDYQGAYEVPVGHPVTVEYLVDYNGESGIPFRDRDGTLVPKVVQTVIFQETCGDDDVVIIEEPPEREFEVYGKGCEDVEGLVERGESADGNILYKLSAGVGGASEDYNVVEIGGQCWFAENLQEHVPVRTSSPAYRRGGIDTGFYGFYEDKDGAGNGSDIPLMVDHDEREGYLYQWSAAMAGDFTTKTQGPCPDGWHVPDEEDWQKLEYTVGSDGRAQKLGLGGSSGFEALFHGNNDNNWNSSRLEHYENRGTNGGYWVSGSIPTKRTIGNRSPKRNLLQESLNKVGPYTVWGRSVIDWAPSYGHAIRCVINNETEPPIIIHPPIEPPIIKIPEPNSCYVADANWTESFSYNNGKLNVRHVDQRNGFISLGGSMEARYEGGTTSWSVQMSKNPGEPHTTGDVKSINYGDCSEPDSGSCSDTSYPWKNVIGYVGESGHYEVRYQIANVGLTNSLTVVCPEIEKNTVGGLPGGSILTTTPDYPPIVTPPITPPIITPPVIGGGRIIETPPLEAGECGDRILHLGEQCDDGNRDEFDGCTSTCQISLHECSDDNENNNDGCVQVLGLSANGEKLTINKIASCGDGVVYSEDGGNEQCDDGNNEDGDGCSAMCYLEDVTDDINGLPGDSSYLNSLSSNSLASCGNGIIEGIEECDGSQDCDRNCRLTTDLNAANVPLDTAHELSTAQKIIEAVKITFKIIGLLAIIYLGMLMYGMLSRRNAWYIVAEGDTQESIASLHAISIKKLQKLNRKTRRWEPQIGDKVKVPNRHFTDKKLLNQLQDVFKDSMVTKLGKNKSWGKQAILSENEKLEKTIELAQSIQKNAGFVDQAAENQSFTFGSESNSGKL